MIRTIMTMICCLVIAVGMSLTANAQEMKTAELKTEFLMNLAFDTDDKQNQDLGSRQIAPLVGGSFSGPKLKGSAIPGGADWMKMRADGSRELNVRATLKTDDGELIYISYSGLLVPGKNGLYWRISPRFETKSEKYAWLNNIVAVGVGVPMPGKAAYSIYEVK